MAAQTQVRTNTFKLTSIPNYEVYLHTVEFNPPIVSAKDRRTLMLRLQSRVSPGDFGNTSPYDGDRQLFARRAFPDMTYRVPKHERDQNRSTDPNIKAVEISIKFVKTISASAIKDILRKGTAASAAASDVLSVIAFVNVAVKHDIFLRDFVQTKRSFFPHGPNGRTLSKSIGDGLQLWSGVYLSVRLTQSVPVLNTDTTCMVMMEGGPLDRVMMDLAHVSNRNDLTRNSPNGKANWIKLRRLLKHAEVVTTYTPKPRKYKIQDVVLQGSDYEFEHSESGGVITVAQYFKKAFNKTVDNTRFFAVKVSKSAVIPAPFLELLPGQPFKGVLDPRAVSRVLEFTKLRPDDRFKKIVENSRDLDYRNAPALRDNQIALELVPWQIPAMMLSAPKLLFGNGECSVKEGKWDLMRKVVSEPGKFGYYAVVFFSTRDKPRLYDQVQKLHATCHDIGIAMPSKLPVVIEANPQSDVESVLKKAYMEARAKAGPEDSNGKPLVIAIIPEASQAIKDAVKRAGDVTLGIPTQCFVADKFLKANDQYLRLGALKINARGGGSGSVATNVQIQKVKSIPTMVIGADVSHASPGSFFPSVAGLVGSLDLNFVKYVARCRPQPARTERIEDIKEMMMDLLHSFYTHWKKETKGKKHVLPQRVIFFRDGLSEGEFKVVAEEEIKEIKGAMEEYWLKHGPGLNDPQFPLPKLIYITAIKNHHIRLAPAQGTQADRSGNVFPGTATGIHFSQPNSEDFYLVSHKGLLGTSRPTHYNVLLNDDQATLSTDDLKSLSNALCYDFARATCAVSQVTPVYYAHLVCKRARMHLPPNFRDDPSEVATNTSAIPDQAAAQELFDRVKRDWRPVNENMKNEMYFL